MWHYYCSTHSVYSRIRKPLLALSVLCGSLLWFLFWLWKNSLGLEHVNWGISRQQAVGWDDGFVLSFGVKRMWNWTLFVGGDIERIGFEGEEARGGSQWHFKFQGFISRSCCGCWVKRRWAASGHSTSWLGMPFSFCYINILRENFFSAPCWWWLNSNLGEEWRFVGTVQHLNEIRKCVFKGPCRCFCNFSS